MHNILQGRRGREEYRTRSRTWTLSTRIVPLKCSRAGSYGSRLSGTF